RVVESESADAHWIGAGENLFEPLAYAFASCGVYEPRRPVHPAGARYQHIGFCLLVGVEKLKVGVGERRAGVQHYGERRHPEARGVVPEQRAHRGGDDIGATTHRFGEDDFGGADRDTIESVHQIGEAAAEAPAGDLVGGDTTGLHQVRVYQVVALIVEHDGDVQALALENAGCGKDEAGLPSAEKAADHSDDGLHTRSSSPSFTVALGVWLLPLTMTVRHSSVP